jgi:hypothetical protein
MKLEGDKANNQDQYWGCILFLKVVDLLVIFVSHCMKRATTYDKILIKDILTNSFAYNLSINYMIKQDERRERRIQALMNYSIDVCSMFGEVLLSDDDKGCALILYPQRKRTTLRSITLDLKLIFHAIGLTGIRRAFKREWLIKDKQGKDDMLYIWFIGVNPLYQKQGIGSRLLEDLIQEADNQNIPIYLETSTRNNLPWYQQFGFEIYNQIELGYTLFFLRRLTSR